MIHKKPGKENTSTTLRLVNERLKKNDIKQVIIASSSGETALKLRTLNKEIDIICVTLNGGSNKRGLFEKNKKTLLMHDIKCVMATHSLSGVERSVAKRWQGAYPQLIIADTLRLFSEGMKVCVEITLTATDSGKIKEKTNIMAIAGTSSGADTAIVLKSAHSHTILQDMAINEIICMPKTSGIKHTAQ